jgi:hypothetical protein
MGFQGLQAVLAVLWFAQMNAFSFPPTKVSPSFMIRHGCWSFVANHMALCPVRELNGQNPRTENAAGKIVMAGTEIHKENIPYKVAAASNNKFSRKNVNTEFPDHVPAGSKPANRAPSKNSPPSASKAKSESTSESKIHSLSFNISTKQPGSGQISQLIEDSGINLR